VVGLLDNFRTLLFQPILNNVLDPKAPDGPITLGLLKSPWHFDLRMVVPHFMHNAWTVVAFALIASTIVKGLCDYLGTYLVNYAGFGMITDLRNHLYEATLRRSSSFFHKHATGTILSTLINDVDKVQTAVSSVIGEFLQQFFHVPGGAARDPPGRPSQLGAASVHSGRGHLRAQDRQGSAHTHPHRAGQAGRDSEHPA
jgi:subfamily B ATP-binding cassette protein MsbA